MRSHVTGILRALFGHIHALSRRMKVAGAFVVVLLAILLWPKTPPSIRGVEEVHSEAVLPVAATKPASRPTTTQPVTQQYAGDLPLFAPDEEGADPSWSLPAELKAADLQRFAGQVEKLSKDLPATAKLEAECNDGVAGLRSDQVVALFWARLLGRGFQDKNLPLDWYQVVKDRNSMLGNLAHAAEGFTNQIVQMAIAMRLTAVQVRVIGGKVVIGDVLFVKAAQAYIDQRRPYYERLRPLMESVNQRARQEFRAEIKNDQR
jgi:hypothetical protein